MGPVTDPTYVHQTIFLPAQDKQQTKRLLAAILSQLEHDRDTAPTCFEARKRFAEAIYRARRLRSSFFSELIFAEPAWDILLLLYSVERTEKRLSVSAVSVSCDAPATTVLRWIDKLVQARLVTRERHPTDRRVFLLRLSDETVDRLDAYCDKTLTTYFDR